MSPTGFTGFLFAVAAVLAATTTNVNARLSVVGGGEAAVFTGTTFGETQEIRTPVVSGFESFTVSFWHKVVTPRSNIYGTDSGIPGSLWSYWAVNDGPSLGSGWTEKRANGQDVFKSTPIFSAYAYNADRFVKHNGHTLSPGKIPYVLDTSTQWVHYVFSYDGEQREIVKYQNASDCFRNSVCQGQVENTAESVEDVEYLQGLKNGRVPKGMFRFGQSDPDEPTLTMELDDICIFNRTISLEDAADIQDFGCDSVTGLALNYNFDQRRLQSPDLFDTVSGTYNGIAKTYIDRSTVPLTECDNATTTISENVAACENSMVPGLFQGVFSQQLMLDFGGDIGPVHSNQGSTSTSSSSSAKMNIIRARSFNSGHVVSINAQCKANCRRFTITSLPSEGVLCFKSKSESGESSCAGPDIITINTVVPLMDGQDSTNIADYSFRKAVPIYYYPIKDSVVGARDSFKMMADSNGATAETAELTVQIITNTPAIAMDTNVTMNDGTTQRFHLPGQSEYLKEIDGKRETVKAVVVRVEYNHLVNNPPRIKVRTCTNYLGCDSTSVSTQVGGQVLDVQMPFHENERAPVYVPTLLRDIYIEHTEGSGTGEGIVSLIYRMYDGIEVGPEAKLIVTITGKNMPPVVDNATMSVLEGTAGGIPISLSSLTADAEGDAPLWRISMLPENGRVFQVDANGDKGAEVLMESASGDVQQWTDGTMNPTSTSEWLDWGVDKIDGPPKLYPRAGDITGVFTPASDWDRSDVTLVLFVRKPVFLFEISFFFTWGPGAVVQIETRPSFDETDPVKSETAIDNEDEWQVVYSGENTQTSYCVGKPGSEPCADITRHRLCPKPYKTNSFRVKLSAASLGHYIAIDAVLTAGMSSNEANVVVHPEGKLLWEPNQYFNGGDALSFIADDCPAFQVLQMDPLERMSTQQGTIKVDVTGVNDAPKVQLGEKHSGNFPILADQSKLLLISLSVLDVDNDDEAILTIDVLPNVGNLWISELNGAEGGQNTISIDTLNAKNEFGAGVFKVEKAGTFLNSGSELHYQAGQCEDFGIQDVSFSIIAEDSGGASASQVIKLTVDCSQLPLRWVVDLPGDSSVIFGMFCAVMGLLICAVAIYFNVAYRNHMAVRISSFRVNVAMFIGCGMIFGALLSMSLDKPSPDCFVDGEPEGLLASTDNVTSQFTGNCPNLNCFSRIWLLDCGAVITWGSLYAKTYRIRLLFMARDLRTKIFTDRDIARGVSTYLLGTIIMLASVSAYIGWPELELSTTPAVMSSTGNEKLIRVTATCSGGDAYTALLGVSIFAFALLQGFSAHIAFSIRNINIKQVNDSKQIAIAIYTSFVTGLPGIVVGSLVQSSDLSFMITVFSIFLATVSVVVSMAAPRMLDVYSGVDVQIGATGSNPKPAPTYIPTEVSFFRNTKLDSHKDTPASLSATPASFYS